MSSEKSKIGNPRQRVKLAAGLFWADYAVLGAQVQELEQAGADWCHPQRLHPAPARLSAGNQLN